MVKRIELDIGCGRGAFITRIARENPETSFIGIDINERNAQLAQQKAARERRTNVVIVHDEAEKFIQRSVRDELLSAIHIYFPTPYITEIRDHNILGHGVRHRLVSLNFLRLIHFKCRAGAVLRIVTDHRGYFHDITAALSRSPFVETRWYNPITSSTFNNLVGTGWEKKQRALGKDIYFLQAAA